MVSQLFVLQNNAAPGPQSSVFLNKRQFRLSLPLYIEHVQTVLGLSDEMLAAAYNLLAALLESTPEIALNPLNVQKLLFTSLSLVYKLLSENPITQSKLAEVGGIHLDDLNSCEVAFLRAIEWKLSLGDVARTLEIMLAQTQTHSSSDEEGNWKHLKAEENEECSELSAFF